MPRKSMRDEIIEYLQKASTHEATATQLCRSLNFNRTNVSGVLNNSGFFVRSRKEGRDQYYKLNQSVKEPLTLPDNLASYDNSDDDTLDFLSKIRDKVSLCKKYEMENNELKKQLEQAHNRIQELDQWKKQATLIITELRNVD